MTNINTATTVQKLWDYCNVLRDDVSYGDYVEQRTYLPFLKMADERTKDQVDVNCLRDERLRQPILSRSFQP